jgi:hypothetical protein
MEAAGMIRLMGLDIDFSDFICVPLGLTIINSVEISKKLLEDIKILGT